MEPLQAVSKSKKESSSDENKKYKQYHPMNIKVKDDLDKDIQPIYSSSMLSINNSRKNSASGDKTYLRRDFQDANVTKFVNQQLFIIRLCMMMLSMVSIVLSLIAEELILYGSENLEEYILILHTMITISLIIFAITKHFKLQVLTEKQLIKKSDKDQFWGFTPISVLEMVILVMHPNILSHGVTVYLQEPVNGTNLPYKLNNFFQILMMLRIYLFYSSLLSTSIYLSTRASRICRIYGSDCDYLFGLKCVFAETPLVVLCTLFLGLLVVLANMVRISERQIPGSGLSYLENSLWCVVITMGTVGYGQYSPSTYLGRIILFMASISGIIMSSLLILTLSTYLSMLLAESKSHVTLHRLLLRKDLELLAREVISQTTMISMNTMGQSSDQKLLSELKKKSDEVHHRSRKIKNLIDTENINEQMQRLFEALDDSMLEIYQRQKRNAEQIINLYQREQKHINEIKFSFTEEIQQLIKDR